MSLHAKNGTMVTSRVGNDPTSRKPCSALGHLHVSGDLGGLPCLAYENNAMLKIVGGTHGLL
jgi:hypothetical protein